MIVAKVSSISLFSIVVCRFPDEGGEEGKNFYSPKVGNILNFLRKLLIVFT
jgi:hypothetical protein